MYWLIFFMWPTWHIDSAESKFSHLKNKVCNSHSCRESSRCVQSTTNAAWVCRVPARMGLESMKAWYRKKGIRKEVGKIVFYKKRAYSPLSDAECANNTTEKIINNWKLRYCLKDWFYPWSFYVDCPLI